MFKKILLFLLPICIIGAAFNTSYSDDRHKAIKIVHNGDALRGDTGPIVYGPNSQVIFDNSPLMTRVTSPTADVSVTVAYSELNTNARSQYDLQSNGVCHYIWQESANPNRLHAVFMTSTDPGPSYTDRNARYFYSTNAGTSWTYLGTVGTTRSGFPCLSATPDGRGLVIIHNTDGGGIQRGQLYVDLLSGIGSWLRLDPGVSNAALGNIWGVCAGTNSRAFIVGSQNGVDSCEFRVTTSLSPPGNWLPWGHVPEGETAQQYAVAIGTGKWGIAFNTLSGGASIIESTNEGATWGSPTTIWTYNASDTIGTLRSIDLIYEGANPRVILGLGHVDPVGGTFTPGLWSKEIFWAPDVNGGNPVTVDSAAGLNGSNSTNDVFFSVTRGVIGKSADGNALYVAYNKARQDTSSIGNNYFDVWFRYSTNHGLTWSIKTQLTNLTGQGILADYRYPAISQSNNVTAPFHYVYLTVSRDTVPGSNVNGAPASTTRDMFLKLSIDDPIGIHNINGEVPKDYSLSQNYPNPFNPSTNIKFALPKDSKVTLKVYDIMGREVATLINNESLSAGLKEIDFNAANLASGIYLYKIEAGEFTATKKMIIVK